MMKKAGFLIVFILLIGSVAAEEIFKVGNNVTLKRSCYMNNTWCDSSTQCNITIKNPSDVVIKNNKPMNYQTSYFDYSLGELNDSGVYTTSITCSSNGLNGYEDFTFRITRTGAELSSYNVTLYIIGIIGILAFGILCLILSNRLSFQSESRWVANINTALKWFMINLAAASSLIIVYFIRFILESQEVGNEFLIKVFDYLGLVLMYFLGAFFLVTMGVMIYNFIENAVIAKKAKEEEDD